MAAGLGFKTFTTGEVLTAANVNGYLMQGIWVFASNAARDAAVTSPQEGNFAFTKDTNSLWYYDGAAWVSSGATGDIEGVTAGVGISGGGTSGTVTVTNSMATAIDAKGDLVAGTGADTFAKLTVGANNTVLTADSTEATGLKWATPAAGGGANWSLLNSGGTALTGASTITVSGISGKDKIMVLFSSASSGSASSEMSLQLNTDTGSNYHRFGQYNQPAATYTVGNFTIENGSADTRFFVAAMGNNASAQCAGYAMITGCNSSGVKVIQAVGGGSTGGGNSQIFTSLGGYYNSSSTISSISLICTGSNFDGGTIYVYTSA